MTYLHLTLNQRPNTYLWMLSWCQRGAINFPVIRHTRWNQLKNNKLTKQILVDRDPNGRWVDLSAMKGQPWLITPSVVSTLHFLLNCSFFTILYLQWRKSCKIKNSAIYVCECTKSSQWKGRGLTNIFQNYYFCFIFCMIYVKFVYCQQTNKKHTTKYTHCRLECNVLIYLNQWSSTKEEAKQIGHDVIADHTGDGDNEPGKQDSEIFPMLRVAMFFWQKRLWKNVCNHVKKDLSKI